MTTSLLLQIQSFVTEIVTEIGHDHTNAIYVQCLGHEARINGLQVVIKPARYVYYKSELVGLYNCDMFMTNTSGDKAYITLDNDLDIEKFREEDALLIDVDFLNGLVEEVKKEK